MRITVTALIRHIINRVKFSAEEYVLGRGGARVSAWGSPEKLHLVQLLLVSKFANVAATVASASSSAVQFHVFFTRKGPEGFQKGP